jgi:hypothetical protein
VANQIINPFYGDPKRIQTLIEKYFNISSVGVSLVVLKLPVPNPSSKTLQTRSKPQAKGCFPGE